MKLKFLLLITIMCFVAAGCRSNRKSVEMESGVPYGATTLPPRPIGVGQMTEPQAVIYQTNVDVSDKVPIELNADGSLRSFPDPADINPYQAPLALVDGWLLDRRGSIGHGTVFLKYTYNEYSSLGEVPSLDELLAAVVPDAKVTMALRLNMPASVARNDTATVNAMIRAGLTDAVTIIKNE